jgi:4-oxalocrotonate tautomerase
VPHIIVKLWPGQSDEQKHKLSDAIVRDVTSILNYGDQSVSVGFDEVSPQDWEPDVFRRYILKKLSTLTRVSGYGQRPMPASG